MPLLITPGSEQTRATIERDGLLADLEAIGATVLANACGPCIGQWSRPEAITGQTNTIVTSFNRNFPKRNDGSANTLAFVTSPDTVMAIALAGASTSTRRPTRSPHPTAPRSASTAPVGQVLPDAGYDPGEDTFTRPAGRRPSGVEVDRQPHQRSAPAAGAVPGLGRRRTTTDLPVLVKAQGKFTTDHISMAGPWLKYRGHLENISGNLYLGAVNAFASDGGLRGRLRQEPAHRRDRRPSPTSPRRTTRPASRGS